MTYSIFCYGYFQIYTESEECFEARWIPPSHFMAILLLSSIAMYTSRGVSHRPPWLTILLSGVSVSHSQPSSEKLSRGSFVVGARRLLRWDSCPHTSWPSFVCSLDRWVPRSWEKHSDSQNTTIWDQQGDGRTQRVPPVGTWLKSKAAWELVWRSLHPTYDTCNANQRGMQEAGMFADVWIFEVQFRCTIRCWHTEKGNCTFLHMHVVSSFRNVWYPNSKDTGLMALMHSSPKALMQ